MFHLVVIHIGLRSGRVLVLSSDLLVDEASDRIREYVRVFKFVFDLGNNLLASVVGSLHQLSDSAADEALLISRQGILVPGLRERIEVVLRGPLGVFRVVLALHDIRHAGPRAAFYGARHVVVRRADSRVGHLIYKLLVWGELGVQHLDKRVSKAHFVLRSCLSS